MADSRGVARLLWNGAEARPRAPWRFVIAAALLVVGVLAGTAAGMLLTAIGREWPPGAVTAVVSVAARLLQLAGFVGALLVAAAFVDRRRLTDVGLGTSRAWWADLGFGLALGVALPGLVFAAELAAGLLRVTGTLVVRADPTLAVGDVPAALALALTFTYFVGVGVFEELLFRGYLLTNVAEGLAGRLGPRGALAAAAVVSSLAFGAGHASNPNVTALAVTNIALYGGLFAASYLLTGRIAVAVGFHLAWNFAIASVFGFPVSGVTTPVTLLAVEQSGPALVTGGGFGPEGGLVALGALVAGAGALAWWVRRTEGELRWRVDVAAPSLRGGSESSANEGDDAGRRA